MYKDIEFVCTGNNTRSRIASAAGQHVLDVLGIEDIRISSSGIFVDFLDNGKPEDFRKYLRPLVTSALEIGALTKGDGEEFEVRPREVFQKLFPQEISLVERYLQEAGYKLFPHTPKQTIVRPEAKLILPIGVKNLKKTQDIYKGVEPKPRIESLEEFSGIEANFDEYPTTYEQIRRLASSVDVAGRVAVLRAIGYINIANS